MQYPYMKSPNKGYLVPLKIVCLKTVCLNSFFMCRKGIMEAILCSVMI